MSDPKWQDVADQIFGGAGAPKTRAEAYDTLFQRHEPKRKRTLPSPPIPSGEGLSSDTLLAVLMAIVFTGIVGAILIAHFVPQTKDIPCAEMLNWAVSDLPARCLAEFSEMKPR